MKKLLACALAGGILALGCTNPTTSKPKAAAPVVKPTTPPGGEDKMDKDKMDKDKMDKDKGGKDKDKGKGGG